MSRTHPEIQPPTLEWCEDGTPRSRVFDDIYFSPDDGESETRHVFIEANRLRLRFQQLPEHGHFVIAETGFGTGLNFLVAAQDFLENAPSSTRLHFISFEKHPLRPSDLQRSLARLMGRFGTLPLALCEQYPESISGPHRLLLSGGRIALTLYWGDAVEGLSALDFQADAWFLDGFAPRKNPDMWSEPLMQLITQRSRPRATLATFTAAGQVRRTLAKLGWHVTKQPGFGRKRHMVIAERPEPGVLVEPVKRPRVLVVGAGIAGSTLAWQLSQLGCQANVWESGSEVAAGASGNSQGALYIKPGVEWSPHTQLHWLAYLFALRFYGHITDLPSELTQFHGLIALASSEKEAERQDKLLSRNTFPKSLIQGLGCEALSELAGIPLKASGLYFPRGGWTQPARLCQTLLDKSQARIHLNRPLQKLERIRPTDGSAPFWQAQSTDTIESFDAVVLCTASVPNHALPEAWQTQLMRLPFKAIRGQITALKPTKTLATLKLPVCGEGYLLPSLENGLQWCGASFEPGINSLETKPDDNTANYERVRALTSAADALEPLVLIHSGRCSVRSALPDYLPIAGHLGDFLGNSAQGLHAITGLGSKGLVLAPLLSHMICNRILGEPLPLPQALVARLSPMRYGEEK